MDGTPDPDPLTRPTRRRRRSQSRAWNDGDELSFHDILDMINPLQHIPLISTMYRYITGDTPGNVARIVGDGIEPARMSANWWWRWSPAPITPRSRSAPPTASRPPPAEAADGGGAERRAGGGRAAPTPTTRCRGRLAARRYPLLQSIARPAAPAAPSQRRRR